MNKQHIIDEIRRTAGANGGKLLGRDRFLNETAIKDSDWQGKFWPRWSAAVEEAGFSPQKFQGKNDRLHALKQLAEFTRKLGKFPTRWELELERRADVQFPNPSSLLRPGAKGGLIEELAEYCRTEEGLEDVIEILEATTIPSVSKELANKDANPLKHGYVYLFLSAKRYKIGYSVAALSRTSVVSNLTPEGGHIVHLIRTDDPAGIERYWHNRFAEKRGNGEWFSLSASDIAAFKRRKFM